MKRKYLSLIIATALLIAMEDMGESVNATPMLSEYQEILSKVEEANSNIQKLDEELQKIVKTKMIDIKKDMKKIQQSKAAFNQYSNFNGNAMIFSTQI